MVGGDGLPGGGGGGGGSCEDEGTGGSPGGCGGNGAPGGSGGSGASGGSGGAGGESAVDVEFCGARGEAAPADDSSVRSGPVHEVSVRKSSTGRCIDERGWAAHVDCGLDSDVRRPGHLSNPGGAVGNDVRGHVDVHREVAGRDVLPHGRDEGQGLNVSLPPLRPDAQSAPHARELG